MLELVLHGGNEIAKFLKMLERCGRRPVPAVHVWQGVAVVYVLQCTVFREGARESVLRACS